MAIDAAIASSGSEALGRVVLGETDRGRRPVDERILRLRRRLPRETPVVSIERAKYYTEHWRSTEESGLAPGIRVALAMKHVYERMRHQIHPDDCIAGAWTSRQIRATHLGLPRQPSSRSRAITLR